MKEDYIIEAKNLCKDYYLGKTVVRALRGVTLKIERSDFAMIVGPSGSGKSTLMHLLGALDHPTRGEVLIDKENISLLDDWHLAMLRRKKMGFIFQAFNLIPTLTAIENVMIPTEPINIPEEEVYRKALLLLKEVGLEKRINHKPDELSGGERQRVSICRALINNPEIIYADEPTGNLDSKTGLKIIELMRKLNMEEKKTFIIVTHDTSLLKFASVKFHLMDGLIEKIEER